MALGNCDSCGENPVNFMLSNVDNGNTQGLCQWCLIVFSGQLAEQLGLAEAPPEEGTNQAANGSNEAASTPAQKVKGPRRAAASRGTTTPDAAPGQEEAPATAAADAG